MDHKNIIPGAEILQIVAERSECLHDDGAIHQIKLAGRLGVSQSNISTVLKFETQSITPFLAYQLMVCMGLEPNKSFGWEPIPDDWKPEEMR